MGQYKINSQNSRISNLTGNDIHLGSLNYAKWYSTNAHIILADNSRYQIVRKRWGTRIELKQDDKILFDLKTGWRGMNIHTYFDNKETNYLLKLKNILSRKYSLIDTDKKELLTVNTKFKWTKFRYDYEITATDEFETLKNKEILLLLVIYSINYHISTTTAAVS